jgi:hypothetical protein
MRYLHLGALLITTFGIAHSAAAANTYKVNPMGLAYRSTADVAQYGQPSGMLITGRCNRYDAAFAAARANGAEILAYLNPVEVGDRSPCALDDGFYMGERKSVPLWPFPSYGARTNYPDNHLADLRSNSAWSNYVVAYVEKLMREDRVDGVLLDVVGARLWSSLANWDSWPRREKDEWTDGCVDLVRRLDAARRAINPRFIIVNNNTWSRGSSDLRGNAGEQYVDGVMLEHQPSTSAFNVAYAGRPFGNLGHRRVLVIGTSTADARRWKDVQGVTHVSDQASYGSVTPPPVSFNRLVDRPRILGHGNGGAVSPRGVRAN